MDVKTIIIPPTVPVTAKGTRHVGGYVISKDGRAYRTELQDDHVLYLLAWGSLISLLVLNGSELSVFQ